jgi:amidase
MTFNLTGWPAAVVRSGTSPEGLPIGVQIVARPWNEHEALALAQYIEAALNGWPRPLL